MHAIDGLIRAVADYPKPGIMFRDITPLLANPPAFQAAIAAMAEPWRQQGVERVAGIEARGFIFGVALAQYLQAGFVPLRKPGKLPPPVQAVRYQLEYGSDSLEVRDDAFVPGQRVLLVDDVLATGGTLLAARQLLRQMQAEVVGASVLIELDALGGRARWDDADPASSRVHAIVHY